MINQNGWPIDNIDCEQCLYEFNDDKDYPIKIVQHLIDSFTQKEVGKYEFNPIHIWKLHELVFPLDHSYFLTFHSDGKTRLLITKIARFRAIQLFKLGNVSP